ncbi:hypothetical protein ACQ7B2_24930, partial [Escherichia coli]
KESCSWRLALKGVGVAVAACVMSVVTAAAGAADSTPDPAILAPVNHQVGWLNLVAPRPQLITRFDAPDFVT